jgi:hypothetical protein
VIVPSFRKDVKLKARTRIKIILLVILVTGFGVKLFDAYRAHEIESEIKTTESVLVVATSPNETGGGQQIRWSPPSLAPGEGSKRWQIFWRAEELSPELRNWLGPQHLPFQSADSYRALMKVEIGRKTFVIERNAGRPPELLGEMMSK